MAGYLYMSLRFFGALGEQHAFFLKFFGACGGYMHFFLKFFGAFGGLPVFLLEIFQYLRWAVCIFS